MKKFICQVCGHVEFNEAPGKCPVCGYGDKFKENAAPVQTAADPANLTEAEKKHVPQLQVTRKCDAIDNCADVLVTVGAVPHPMEEKHYITYIDLYIDHKYASRIRFAPGALNAAAGFHLKKGQGLVTAVENCNLHGAWMAETTL